MFGYKKLYALEFTKFKKISKIFMHDKYCDKLNRKNLIYNKIK